MKITIKSETLYARIAKNLRKLLTQYSTSPVPESFNYKDATAFVFGHENYLDHKHASPIETSWDEDCDTNELCRRRNFQAERLVIFSRSFNLELTNVHELISLWQPSAGRPRNPTISKDECERLREQGLDREVFRLLISYQDSGAIPTKNDLALIYKGLKCCKDHPLALEALTVKIGLLAVGLANKQSEQEKACAASLFEMICETDIYAKISLARILLNGWGVRQDIERARTLCLYVNKQLQSGRLVFTDILSRIDYYMLQGQVFGQSELLDQRLMAYNSFREAASLGSGKAALMLTSYLTPHSLDKPDVFSNVVPPNPDLAMYYFMQAIKKALFPLRVGANLYLQ